jgi:hypothetical protein
MITMIKADTPQQAVQACAVYLQSEAERMRKAALSTNVRSDQNRYASRALALTQAAEKIKRMPVVGSRQADALFGEDDA